MEDYSNLFYNAQDTANKDATTYNNMLIAQDNRMKMRIAGLQYQNTLKEMGLTDELNLLVGQQAQAEQTQPNVLSASQPQPPASQPVQPNMLTPTPPPTGSQNALAPQPAQQANPPLASPKLSKSALMRQQASKESDPQKAGEMIAFADNLEKQEKQAELKQAQPFIEKTMKYLEEQGAEGNKAYQKILATLKSEYGIKLPEITLTDKGEKEVKGEITDLKSPMLAALKDKVKDNPELSGIVDGIKIGDTVHVKYKNSKPVSIDVEHGKSPDDIQGYKLAQSQGYKGSFLQYKKELKEKSASDSTDKEEKKQEKEVTKTLGLLRKHEKFYQDQNKEFEKRIAAKGTTDKQIAVDQDHLDFNNQQIAAVEGAISDVESGIVSPKEVWVNNKPKTTTPAPTQQKKASAPVKAATPKKLDEATAKAILKEANGDKDKAREIAKGRGYTF